MNLFKILDFFLSISICTCDPNKYLKHAFFTLNTAIALTQCQKIECRNCLPNIVEKYSKSELTEVVKNIKQLWEKMKLYLKRMLFCLPGGVTEFVLYDQHRKPRVCAHYGHLLRQYPSQRKTRIAQNFHSALTIRGVTPASPKA